VIDWLNGKQDITVSTLEKIIEVLEKTEKPG